MKVKKSGNKVIFTLGRECTIADVEAHTEKLRSMLKDGMKIEVDAGDVEEMDTAYFQLLLSLKASSDQSGAGFFIADMSDRVREVFDLYGVNTG